MYLSGENLLIILLVGLIAGWLAAIVADGGFGLIGNIALGIVGGLLGSWLFPRLGVHIGAGIVSKIIVATIGAILILFIFSMITGGFPRRRRFWRF